MLRLFIGLEDRSRQLFTMNNIARDTQQADPKPFPVVGKLLPYIASGASIPKMESVRTSSRWTTAAVDSSNDFRLGFCSVSM
jgi:hypothetical protein